MNNKFPGKDISEEDLVSKIPLSASKGITQQITVGGVTFGGSEVPVVAGPNTVESEEMIVDSWFGELCRNVGGESGVNMNQRTAGYINVNNLGNGRTEVS